MRVIYLLFIFIPFLQCTSYNSSTATVSSPDQAVQLDFFVNDGKPGYMIKYNDDIIIDTSYFSFEFANMPPLADHITIKNSALGSFSDEWEMPWGEQRMVTNTYNELEVELNETAHPYRIYSVHFKLYDDGLGFRYEFPEQEQMKKVTITDEHTAFNLTSDPMVTWQPGDWDIYEYLYHNTRLSEINAFDYFIAGDHLGQVHLPENAVNTPVTMRLDNGVHLSFHEANLTNYAGMTLKVDTSQLSLVTELVGSDKGHKVITETPFVTPWRTIQITDKAEELIESNLIVNLNEPSVVDDMSWFVPHKYMGIWWEMHLGISSWDLASGKHGATTENAKRHIDFASKNNIKGLLVEGWNTGWEDWINPEDRENIFDFVTPYSDYDIHEVVRYGKEKGVGLIMHHETSAAPRTYMQQLDTAYAFMESLDIHAVKSGYVGKLIPDGEYHHGQWMVNMYRKALEEGAKRKIAINAHEPIKATGLRRTYPNAISREGLRGQEYNAWAGDGGNPADHMVNVAFTRMLAGPIDFTPGIFNISLAPYKDENQINTTLAHQLALYVVIYSPIQMVPDLIEHYEGNPAFQFIREVGVDWEKTDVLDGALNAFVVIARQERETGNWFVGGITTEEARSYALSFDFLPEGETYKAFIYMDGDKAHYKNNPTDILITSKEIDKGSAINIKMASGGGFAISLIKN